MKERINLPPTYRLTGETSYKYVSQEEAKAMKEKSTATKEKWERPDNKVMQVIQELRILVYYSFKYFLDALKTVATGGKGSGLALVFVLVTVGVVFGLIRVAIFLKSKVS